ncbi:MAG: hypothetical protein EP330_18660 [Deltaproteobacteria bacterium]|nr:MAG: hypothetical protein EP330_18660 [Deltaproteobacteria bacterium]
MTLGVLAASVLSLTGTWTQSPSLALCIALAVGVVAVNPRLAWALPLVGAGVIAGGMLAEMVRIPAVLGAGAVAGVGLSALAPVRTDWLDHLNASLAAAAGAAIGLWGATQILPDVVSTTSGAALAAGFMCLGAAQSLWPLALRQANGLPSARDIQKALEVRYRPPVFRAVELHEGASRHAPDPDAQRGLTEVVQWVFRLQQTLQDQDRDLATIDPVDVNKRIDEAESAPSTDAFTRERRQATARHLRRLLAHREAIATERERQSALVEYALAFLEEARAGAAVGRILPGESAPDRLGDVLSKLRTHAAEGEARRQTRRELQSS